jgi:hypothetical protein
VRRAAQVAPHAACLDEEVGHVYTCSQRAERGKSKSHLSLQKSVDGCGMGLESSNSPPTNSLSMESDPDPLPKSTSLPASNHWLGSDAKCIAEGIVKCCGWKFANNHADNNLHQSGFSHLHTCCTEKVVQGHCARVWKPAATANIRSLRMGRVAVAASWGWGSDGCTFEAEEEVVWL